MNNVKYRIKKLTYQDGRVEFCPQVGEEYLPIDEVIGERSDGLEWFYLGDKKNVYNTIEEAQYIIDRAKQRLLRPIKIEYIEIV